MRSEVLLAVIMKQVEEKLEGFSQSVLASRTRGPAGRSGADGKDFDFSAHESTIKTWAQEFALKFQDLTPEQIEGLRGPVGRAGVDGRAGKDFDFAEHEETIKTWAKDFALKFEDLEASDIEKLRGPRGKDGVHGRDGADFNFADHEETIRAWAQGAALKFEDLSVEQIGELRGPKGRDGKDGEDFKFEDHAVTITQIVFDLVGELHDQLRLKFENLTSEEIEQLRGPRGRDGRDGKGFDFDSHRAYFESLRPSFSDFTAEERGQLVLRFAHLTESEKAEIKLKFSDLSDDERRSLRGARGSRGQRGPQGADGNEGAQGRQGARGVPGTQGTQGLTGRNGEDGVDGRNGVDAPYVTDIKLDQTKDEIEFVFDFSDGSTLRTNSVTLPRANVYVAQGGGGGRGPKGDKGDPGSGGGGGEGSSAVFALIDNDQSAQDIAGLVLDSTAFQAYRIDYRVKRRTSTDKAFEAGTYWAVYDSIDDTWTMAATGSVNSSGVVLLDPVTAGQVLYNSTLLAGDSHDGEISIVLYGLPRGVDDTNLNGVALIDNDQSSPVAVTGLILDHTEAGAYRIDFFITRETDTDKAFEAGTYWAIYDTVDGTWTLAPVGGVGSSGVNILDPIGDEQVLYNSTNMSGTGYDGEITFSAQGVSA